MQHEAGHFLVGYLLGVLPRGYNITSIEDLKRDNFGIARIEFVGLEFLKEVRNILLFFWFVTEFCLLKNPIYCCFTLPNSYVAARQELLEFIRGM